jgi:HEAT repeat protein
VNCQDINRLLDASAAGDLTPAQSDAVRAHLDSCHACNEDWASWNEMSALPVPATSPGLLARIAAALPAKSPAPTRWPLRPFLIGGALVAGLALAATAAWRVTSRQPLAELTAASASDVAEAVPGVPESAPTAPAIIPAMADEQSASTVPAALRVAASVALHPRTIAVVKRPEVAADAPAIALADRCYDTVVSELRGLGGLNVVVDSSTFRMKSFAEELSLPERDQKLALSHGAGHMLVVTTQMGCNFALFNSQTGTRVQGAGGGGVEPQGGREHAFAKSIARSVHAHILVDKSAEAAEARINLLNTVLGDRDRAVALTTLVRDRSISPMSREAVKAIFDKEVITAAIQLATKSPDAEVRARVWVTLREADDPAMIQPLLQALASDPSRDVRFQAIQSVRKFLDMPGVREALLRAAAEDPDSQLEHFCCVVTVREAAERASVPNSEFRAWARRTLLNEALSARSRLINLVGFSNDGRFVGKLASIGSDAAGVVFNIGQRDPDPRVRAMAWDVLYFGQADRDFVSTEVVPVLLGDLRNSPNESVRAAAAKILVDHDDSAEVREALQRAQVDASIEVRRAVMGEGGGPASAE